MQLPPEIGRFTGQNYFPHKLSGIVILPPPHSTPFSFCKFIPSQPYLPDAAKVPGVINPAVSRRYPAPASVPRATTTKLGRECRSNLPRLESSPPLFFPVFPFRASQLRDPFQRRTPVVRAGARAHTHTYIHL